MELSKNKKVSINIITFNEGNKLRDFFEVIKWAEEIIVIDSFTIDKIRYLSVKILSLNK